MELEGILFGEIRRMDIRRLKRQVSGDLVIRRLGIIFLFLSIFHFPFSFFHLYAVPGPVTDLTVTSGWRRVTLNWSAPYDVSASTTPVVYEIRCSTYTILSSTNDWTNKTSSGWPYRIKFSTATTPGALETFIVTGLTNIKTYFFAIRSSTDTNAGESDYNIGWSGMDTTETEPIGQPVNNIPGNVTSQLILPPTVQYTNTIVGVSTPTFSWEPVSPGTPDENHGDTVTYTVWLSTSWSFYPKWVTENITTTYYSFPFTLNENTTYYRKIFAVDSDGAESQFKMPINENDSLFIVNSINSSPSVVTLTGPGYGGIQTSYPINFSWSGSSDIDPGDSFTYTFYTSTVPINVENYDISITTVVNTGTNTSYSQSGPLIENATYYWCVKTEDTGSGIHPSSYSVSLMSVIRININGESPLPFNLVSPSSGSVVLTSTPVFDWEDAIDPDPGDYIDWYKIYYSSATSDPFNDQSLSISSGGIKISQFIPETPLVENATYWWCVEAKPTYSGSSRLSDETWSLVVDAINTLPSTPTLTSPEVAISTDQARPYFEWTQSYDPDPFSTFTYTIVYSSDEFLTSVSSSGLKVNYFIPDYNLQENTKYCWYVRVIDNRDGITTSSTSYFYVNITTESPTSFDIISPSTGSIHSYLKIFFNWQNSYDPDPEDIISYELYFSTDSSFDVKISTIITGIVFSSYTINSQLLNNSTYYWKVKAVSSGSGQVWSNLIDGTTPYFYTRNIAPDYFSLISPSDGQIISGQSINFLWQSAYDTENDTVTYTIYYSTDSSFNFTHSSSGLTTTSFSTSTISLEENAKYYWRVKAVDYWQNETISGTSYFYINKNQEPPGVFNLLSPPDNTLISSVVLDWEDTIEPDPLDTLRYQLWVSTDINFATDVSIVISGLISSNYSLTQTLQGQATYYWKVKAYGLDDPSTTYTWSSSIFAFFTPVAQPEQPSDVKAVLSKDRNSVTISWSPVTKNIDGSECLNLSKYRIYRAGSIETLTNTQNYLAEVSTTTFSYTDSTIEGKSYYIVKAVNQLNLESKNSIAVFVDPSTTEELKVFFNRSNEVILSIPQNLYDEININNNITISITRLPDEEIQGKYWRVYDVKVLRTTEEIKNFNQLLCLDFSYKDIPVSNPEELGVSWHNGVEWIKITPSRDKLNKLLRVKVNHLSRFRIERIQEIKKFTLLNWPPKAKIITPGVSNNLTTEFRINYANPEGKVITGKIFDFTGAFVADMENRPEENAIIWNGKDKDGYVVLPGIYIYQIKVEGSEGETINGAVVIAR